MRVMIIDDDPDICLAMRALFRSEGWEASVAMSGEEALERLDELSGFDVVVVDYRMPGLTGIELARNLRMEGFVSPLIMCSAYLNERIEQEAKLLGVPTVGKMDLRLLIEKIREQALIEST
jgi:CheY-like chemotaxis protein